MKICESITLAIVIALFAMACAIKSNEAIASPVVEKIVDGDTIWVVENNITTKIRFYCIDTPETHYGNQTFGDVEIGLLATAHLKEKISEGKEVELKCTGDKTYDREVCEVFYNGRNINKEMLLEGFAYASKKYCSKEYLDLFNKAKKSKSGLWKLGNWENPAQFRRERRYH